MSSQKDRLLERLQATPGEWVSICELARAMSPSGNGGQGTYVGRRVHDLKRAGYKIENEKHRAAGGQIHSSYRLVSVKPAACASCGKPATCYGRYEDATEGFACDDCCGHVNEVGWCEPIPASSAPPGDVFDWNEWRREDERQSEIVNPKS